MKYYNEKIKYPNFKSSEKLLSSDQVKKLSTKILPDLSDDDYFLDIKNSVVFSYLMNETDSRINSTLSDKEGKEYEKAKKKQKDNRSKFLN